MVRTFLAKFGLLSIFLFLCACSLQADNERTELEQEIDHRFAAFTQKMQDTCELYWQMGGDLVYGVNEVGGGAFAYYRATQEEARRLILQSAEELLSTINSNEKLKPYLAKFPFPSDRLRLKITFQPKRYSFERKGSIQSVTLEGDVVKYFMDYSNVETSSESYQEALNRVKNSPLDSIQNVVCKKIVNFLYGFIDCIAELWVGFVWILFLLYCMVTGGI